MKKSQNEKIFLKYYHCYSSTIANVLDVPEIEILYNLRLLELQINYETNALCSTLYEITDEFVNEHCIIERIKGRKIQTKLSSLENGKYCLLTKTENLKYCEPFTRYTDALHFVTVRKQGNSFYMIDTFDGVDFHELVDIKEFDFSESVLTLIQLRKNYFKRNRLFNINSISTWYVENEKNFTYENYIKYIKTAQISIDTVKSFVVSGFLTSRIAFLDLLKKDKYISSEKYRYFATQLQDRTEHIKLLLAKLQFRQCKRDMNKLIDVLYEIKNIEDQIIKFTIK